MNWKEELLKVRQEAQTAPSSDDSRSIDRTDQQLLADIAALRLLREMNQVLFRGRARIESVRNKDKYRYIIALLWDDSIRSPRFPTLKSEKMNSIFVGVAGGKVYVNGKEVKPITTENLQASLLAQARGIVQKERKNQSREKSKKGK